MMMVKMIMLILMMMRRWMKIRQIRMKRLLITESQKEEDNGQDYKSQHDEDNDNDDYDLLIV